MNVMKRKWQQESHGLFRRKTPLLGKRGVHFDLKGMPPSPRRQLELLDVAAEARYNIALVEWEDSYCWSTYPELRGETAYSERHVTRFLRRADGLGIAVVPLVQCLGHMENVLTRPRFRHLRESADAPGDLCPLKPEGREVVRRMIDDLLRLHGDTVTHLHLGGDEASSFGSCPACRRHVARHGKADLYLQHVTPLLEHVQARGVRPILWDDMLREWTPGDLRRVGRLADLMVWSYGGDLDETLPPGTIDRYARAGIAMWGGACFKGDRLTMDLPDPEVRVDNLLAWMREARRQRLVGVVATGWARHNTLMAPSETIEASLDLMIAAGAALWDGTLPSDAVEVAGQFLHGKRLARLAGNRFDRCRRAATGLRDWRRCVNVSLEWTDAMAQFAGEPERRHERYLSRKGFDALLEKGRRIGMEFVAAHRGLIPDIWLDRYIESRIAPLRRLIDAIYG